MSNAADLRQAGDRIEQLLDELGRSSDPELAQHAIEAVRLVTELHGAALQCVMEALEGAGEAGAGVLDRLVDDELVASLLVVHGLHPLGVAQRVERALAHVRPYLASHGGDVELLEVDDDGVARLRLHGSCDGCPSSQVTLELAVTGAIEAAAPEIARIEVDGADAAPHAGGAPSLIPADSLSRRPSAPAPPPVAAADAPAWTPLPGAEALPSPSLRGCTIGGLDLVVCRLPEGLYVYRDACGACGASLADGVLADGVLACARCGARFDVATAGRDVDQTERHLEPLPLLPRDGAYEVALPVGVA